MDKLDHFKASEGRLLFDFDDVEIRGDAYMKFHFICEKWEYAAWTCKISLMLNEKRGETSRLLG